MLKVRLSILKYGLVLFAGSSALVVFVITLHDYVRQEKQEDWLFEKYNNDDMIIIWGETRKTKCFPGFYHTSTER